MMSRKRKDFWVVCSAIICQACCHHWLCCTCAVTFRCVSLLSNIFVHQIRPSVLIYAYMYIFGNNDWCNCHHRIDCLIGLVVKASASRAKDPGFESHLRQEFSGSSHTNDLRIGTPVANLPSAWRYRVNDGTAWPGVSILWLGETENLTCNFYLSVTACNTVWADPSLRYTSMLLGH